MLHDSHYPLLLRLRPDVAAFYIRLPSRWNPLSVWKEFGIKISHTPHVIIFGPDGKIVAEDKEGGNAGHAFLYKWMNDEVQKDRKLNRKITQ